MFLEISPNTVKKYIEILEKAGLIFSGKSVDRNLMELLELPSHPYFIGTQAHPEFKSRLIKPAPLFIGFIETCIQARGRKK